MPRGNKRPLIKLYSTSIRVSEATAQQVDEIRQLAGENLKFTSIVERGIIALRDQLKRKQEKRT